MSILNDFSVIFFDFLTSHTHINIDAVFPRFTKVFFGWGDVPGLPGGINTMEEFDEEFLKCFKGDDVKLKRMIGCLDFKSIFEGCLGFGNYTPEKKTSASARAQGGRDKEYHSVHFFLDSDNIARCRGRYDELQNHWLPLEGPGIAAFSPIGQLRIQALIAAGDRAATLMPYDSLKDWGLRALIEENLTNHTRLTAVQRGNWVSWFKNLPTSIENVSIPQKFQWALPQLILRVNERERSRLGVTLRPELGESTDYQQDPKFMGEVFTHPGFTEKQLKADRRQRAQNYQNRRSAGEKKKAANRLQERRAKRMQTAGSLQEGKGKEELKICFFYLSSKSQFFSSDQSDSNEAVIRNQEGECVDIVKVGDVVMIMPDVEGVKGDKELGYTLGINVCEVEDVDVSKDAVTVSFFYGKSWEGNWQRWINKSDGLVS